MCAINHHVCEKCIRRSKRQSEFKRLPYNEPVYQLPSDAPCLTCNEPVCGGNAQKTQHRRKFKQIHHQQEGLTSRCYSGVTEKHHNDNYEVGSPDDLQIDGDSQIDFLIHGQVTSDEASSFDYDFDTCDIQEQTYEETESASIIDSIDNQNSQSTQIRGGKLY